jgi:spectinomycin phosphotransferase
VDWDAPILAPREQDLVFAISGGFGRHLTTRRRSLFLRGYGRSTVDDHLMAYYIYERLVDDIQALAEGVLRPSASDASRRRDLDYLRVQLTPHGPAAVARTLDARIRRGLTGMGDRNG